jgi:hypothetical protein
MIMLAKKLNLLTFTNHMESSSYIDIDGADDL